MALTLSKFARELTVETAFDVLAVARQWKAKGKEIVELQIGDSPFSSPEPAKQAGADAIAANQTRYCPSMGLPELRSAVADSLRAEFGLAVGPENVVIGPGAKVFEQFFCEAFLNAGDEVLVFSPYFPTYLPNILRRQAVPVFSALREMNAFRPNLDDVAAFVARPRAKAIFLNSPHNPTGGVATEDDLRGLADLIRGRDLALFSDEPYNHMVWDGSKHHTPLAQPGMMEQCVSAFTFSKSYSMSGWRLGYAVSAPPLAETIGKMVNSALSCVPPLAQLAGVAALRHGAGERDAAMTKFESKVKKLVAALREVPDIRVAQPAGTFYVFPNVTRACNRLGVTSHGLAMFLLEAADDHFGVACLGGECFGDAGHGFLRFSCAESDERIAQAVAFLPTAFARQDRMKAFLETRPRFRLPKPYDEC